MATKDSLRKPKAGKQVSVPRSDESGAMPAPPQHIHDLALRVFGTPAAVEFWMNRPNPELDGLKPDELAGAGRAEVVKDFLESLVLQRRLL